jgi:hypothetical protein
MIIIIIIIIHSALLQLLGTVDRGEFKYTIPVSCSHFTTNDA